MTSSTISRLVSLALAAGITFSVLSGIDRLATVEMPAAEIAAQPVQRGA